MLDPRITRERIAARLSKNITTIASNLINAPLRLMNRNITTYQSNYIRDMAVNISNKIEARYEDPAHKEIAEITKKSLMIKSRDFIKEFHELAFRFQESIKKDLDNAVSDGVDLNVPVVYDHVISSVKNTMIDMMVDGENDSPTSSN